MSAPGLINFRLLATLVCCGLIIGSLCPTQAQTVAVPAVEVATTIEQLKLAIPTGGQTQEAIALGQRLLGEARYAEGYELFAALLEKLPDEAAALYGAALASFNLGRTAEAEPMARRAVEISLAGVSGSAAAKPLPRERRLRSADALVLLAVVLGARGADTEALKMSERAVALAPEHFDAQFTLARARYSVGDAAAAVNAFRAALALKPDDARTRFFLATALEGAGNLAEALNVYRDLVTRQPQAAEGHLGLGALLIKRGGSDIEKGIEELQIAVRINPDLYEAQVALGRALLARKLTQESLAPLQRAAELAPGNPEPHYQLALAYRRLGLTDKASAETAIVKRIHEARRGEGGLDGDSPKPNQP